MGTGRGRGRSQGGGRLGEGLGELCQIFLSKCLFFLSGLLVMVMVIGHQFFVLPGKEGGGPDGGEDFLGRGSDRLGSGPE